HPVRIARRQQGIEVGHHALVVEESVWRDRAHAAPSYAAALMRGTDDLSRIVDAVGERVGFARESTQIGHRPLVPEEGVFGASRKAAPANNLTRVVDTIGLALGPTERTEVGHHSRTVEPRMACAETTPSTPSARSVHLGVADDLPRLINGIGHAGGGTG